jgi:uncharacterized protein
MLLQFTAENFRSIRDEVELSMRTSDAVPGGDAQATRPVVATVDEDLEVLRCAAIYGANASGKSNLVGAMLVARQLVVYGTSSEDARLGIQPFRLDAERRAQPSRFEFYLLVSGQVYGYGFAATDKAITEESLTMMVDGEEIEVFSRQNGQFRSSDALDKEAGDPKFLEYVARGTPSNQLFLYEAKRRNIQSRAIDEVSQWFRLLTIITPSSQISPRKLVKLTASDAEFREFLMRMMTWADTGITHVAVDRRSIDGETAERLKDLASALQYLSQVPRTPEVLVPTDGGGVEELSLSLRHSEDASHPSFGLEDESDGTRVLLHVAPILYLASKRPTLLVIDELDRSLHTLLAQQLIEMFIQHMPAATQLVFTTHDTNLLDCRVLRPDCIWFTEKGPSGATTLFSLSEFKPEQIEVLGKDLEKGYLRGRFGGIPFLGDPARLEWVPRKGEEA